MNLQDLVPKHKHDIETAEKLKQYNYYEIKSIVPDLLKWLQDFNWPVSRPVADYLEPMTDYISDEIIDILRADDGMWKYWVLHVFGARLNNERVLNELERIMHNAEHTELFDVQEFSRVILEKRGYKGLSVRNPFFRILDRNDHGRTDMISHWYFNEWKIPHEKTKEKLQSLSPQEFHVLMMDEDIPVSTGGVYHRVSLVEREPRFEIYKHWLALVYTMAGQRGKGHGAKLCTFIEQEAKARGIKELHLFTDTAERLYARLDWEVLERLLIAERNIVVMHKTL